MATQKYYDEWQHGLTILFFKRSVTIKRL